MGRSRALTTRKKTFVCPLCYRSKRILTMDAYLEPNCANCREPTIYIGDRKLPRKSSPEKTWNAFWNSMPYKPGWRGRKVND